MTGSRQIITYRHDIALFCESVLGGLHLFKQLAVGLRDLSQAEKKVTGAKP